MNISMYTTYANSRAFPSFSDGLRHFYEKGVRYGAFLDVELQQIPFHRYCDYLEDAGLQLDAFISTLDVVSFNEEKRKDNMARLKEQMDLMEKRKIPILMIAPSVTAAKSEEERLRMRDAMVESYSAAIDYAEGSGIQVAVENFSLLTRSDSRMEDLRYLFDCVPKLGFVLDSGNFFCIGEDVLQAYELLSDRIIHAHFKDWGWDPYGEVVRENMPRFTGTALGQGVLPLRELAQRLRQDKPELNVVLEINGKLSKQCLDDSVDFLAEVLLK